MVMRLPKPRTCSLQIVNDIIAERANGKNAAFFKSIETEWRGQVQDYIDSRGSPALMQKWPHIAGHEGKFLNLYLSPTEGSAQGRMLKALREHDLVLCPACGEAGRPNTLDHYLPKGKYPHFCVTPYNLFPMCDACQSQKAEKTGDGADPRFFIHPYFDVFVAEQVLTLSIQPPFETPDFELTPAPGLDSEREKLVARHVRELGIVQRYGHFFRDQHRRLLRLVQAMRGSGQDVPQTIEAFRSAAELPCKNGWDYIFYSAVVSTPNFMSYLQNGVLPSFP